MHDYYSGLDMASFSVTADFEIDEAAAGEKLAGRFKQTADGVWQWKLSAPLASLGKGTLTVSVKDRQGNIARVERTFSVRDSE